MTRQKKGRSGAGAAIGDFVAGSYARNNTTGGRGDASQPVYNNSGRICGEIAGGILRKTAQRQHKLQRPAAWGWDAAIIDQAEAAGVRFTEVECDGRIWRASIADFRRYGIEVGRGYGLQIALPLVYWQTRKAGEPAVSQLSLFGVTP